MTNVVIHVQSKLQWTAIVTESSGTWIAECEPLGLVVEGSTLDELHSLIEEACSLLFLDLFEDNELEMFLRRRGWEAHDLPSENVDDLEFSVPWELVADGPYRGSQRRTH